MPIQMQWWISCATRLIAFNTKDFVRIEQFGLQTLTPAEFLALLQENA